MWTANLPPWCPNRLYSRLALLVAERNSVEGPDDLLNWLVPSRPTGPRYNNFFLRHYGGTEIFKVKRTCVSDWAIEWIVVTSKGHIFDLTDLLSFKLLIENVEILNSPRERKSNIFWRKQRALKCMSMAMAITSPQLTGKIVCWTFCVMDHLNLSLLNCIFCRLFSSLRLYNKIIEPLVIIERSSYSNKEENNYYFLPSKKKKKKRTDNV